MPTQRSYNDACPIARALDVIGERWALLVVRELLLGPQRFSDLRKALPGASSNVVADRLRELQGQGVIDRHRLPPPASVWVYALTDWGRQLEPVMLAIGAWGTQVPPPPGTNHLSATSVLLYMREAAQPDPNTQPATLRLELNEGVWTVLLVDGHVHVQPGDPERSDAQLRTDPHTFNALLGHPELLETVAGGTVTASGDLKAWRRLLALVPVPV